MNKEINEFMICNAMKIIHLNLFDKISNTRNLEKRNKKGISFYSGIFNTIKSHLGKIK